VKLAGLDLNLLIAPEVLLTEKSISRASERLELSQSATSSALSRLREYFEDELLIRAGHKMVLTNRAEALVEPVTMVLQQIRTTIAVMPDFDPQTSDRKISVMASDYVVKILWSSALPMFEKHAPNMRFELLPLNDNVAQDFERGTADLLITTKSHVSDKHPSAHLISDDYVVMAWNENEHVEHGLTLGTFLKLGHVVTMFGRSRMTSFEDWVLRQKRYKRRVEVSVASFAQVPPLLIGTQRLATVHRRMTEQMAMRYPLQIFEPPLKIPSMKLAIQWHNSTMSDAAVLWVVDALKELAKSKFSEPSKGKL